MINPIQRKLSGERERERERERGGVHVAKWHKLEEV